MGKALAYEKSSSEGLEREGVNFERLLNKNKYLFC
jgi:hypothetical protein